MPSRAECTNESPSAQYTRTIFIFYKVGSTKLVTLAGGGRAGGREEREGTHMSHHFALYSHARYKLTVLFATAAAAAAAV